MSRFLPVACAFATATAACAPSYLEPPEDHRALDAQVRALVDDAWRRGPEDRSVGAVIVLDGVVVAQHMGGPAIPTSARFPMASATKLFAGLLGAQLADEGVLDLDAPVGDTIDGLPPRAAVLTPRQLLTHQDGLGEAFDAPGWAELADDDRRDLPRLDYVRLATAAPERFPAGTEARYGQAGLVLFALHLETLLDQPMKQILDERVWQPAGMTSTAPWTRLDPIEGFDGTVSVRNALGYKDVELDYGRYDDLTGNLTTTLVDLGLLFTALQRGDLLSDEAWDLLVTEEDGLGWALAVHPIEADGMPGVGHEGGQSVVVYLSEDRTAASAWIGDVGSSKHLRDGYRLADKAAQGSRLPPPEPRPCDDAPAFIATVVGAFGEAIPGARARWAPTYTSVMPVPCEPLDERRFACAAGEVGLLDLIADAPGYPTAFVEEIDVPEDAACGGPRTQAVSVVLHPAR
jgi:CubicO group peptidase (beta-lactamase class C family)